MSQGRVAGLNAAHVWEEEQGREDSPAVYEPENLPIYIEALGVQIWLSGDISGESRLLRLDMHNGCFRQIFVREGKLIGLSMVGPELPTMKAEKALMEHISPEEAAALFA